MHKTDHLSSSHAPPAAIGSLEKREGSHMRRREFIAGLSGISAIAPLLVTTRSRAQQPRKMRRIGVFWGLAEDDPLTQSDLAALRKALADLGWSEGRNVRFDYRWAPFSIEREQVRKFVNELVALEPDLVVVNTGGLTSGLQRASASLPIVFTDALDPVGLGLVESLARPRTNATGLSVGEFGLSAKLLELLKQIARS